MSFRKKIFLVAVPVITVLSVVYIFLQSGAELGVFRALEEMDVQLNTRYATTAFQSDIQVLNSLANNWGVSDCMYQYMQTGNETHIVSQFTDEKLFSLQLSFVVVLDGSHSVVFSKGTNVSQHHIVEPSSELLMDITSLPIFHTTRNSGIFNFKDGPALVAVQPIMNSEGKGSVMGTLVIGRYLDQNQLDQLSARTSVVISLITPGGAESNPEFRRLLNRFAYSQEFLVEPQDPLNITSYAILDDIEGNPGLIIQCNMPRRVFSKAKEVLWVSYFFLPLLSIGYILLMIFLFGFSDANRLKELCDSVVTISRSGDFSRRVPEFGRGLIGALANEINTMLGTLGKAQHELRDSLQTTAGVVKAIPAGLFVYQFQPPNRLELIDGNEESFRLTGIKAEDCKNLLFDELWPHASELGLTEALLSVVRTGRPFKLEDIHYHDERLDGHYRIHAFSMPGRRLGVIFEEVTQQKKIEEERRNLEEQLYQVQKMEAIGQLAGGIAHDFNNILVGILGHAGMLKLKSKSDGPVYQAACTIEKAAERAAELTRQLLGFARKGKYQNVPVDINQIVREVIELLSHTVDKNVRIKQDLRAAHTVISGDPNQIEQVLLNIAVNARDAMPDGGDLVFESDIVILDEAYCSSHAEAFPGHYMVLSITDTGDGIPKENLAHIFEPFFTTKEKGKGTGMGLAMVYGIVKNHGGMIQVYSEYGHGTTFKVYLPLTAEKRSLLDGLREQEAVCGAGCILLVDDEELVRDMTSKTLRSLGYTVLIAKNGAEALDVFQQYKVGIDLVLLDMIMPEMGGQECLASLRKMDPHIRVILSTGYGLTGEMQKLIEERRVGFIQKPYTMVEISLVVASALKN